MNQGIPKSARDLLAGQAPAEQHPSPDLLNGYVEQALTAREKALVTDHLAACGECREVVFLANAAAEEEMVPAAAAAIPAREERVASAATAAAKSPEPGWPWWKWAAPAFAVFLIAAGAFLERDRMVALLRPSANMDVAVNRTPARPTAPASQTSSEANEVVTNSPKTAVALDSVEGKPAPQASPERAAKSRPGQLERDRPAQEAQARQRQAILQAQLASSLEKPKDALGGSAPQGAAQAPPGAKPTTPRSSSQPAEVISAAPLVQADNADLSTNFSTNAPNGGNDLTYNQKAAGALKSGLAGSNETASSSVASLVASKKMLLHAQWRIRADGHLERSLPGSAWTRVLVDQPVVFRIVVIVGANVWAGGNGGALFHSADQGENWNRVALSAGGQPERAAVVSIQFNNALQGSLSTDSGVTWTTSDGGLTWIRQP